VKRLFHIVVFVNDDVAVDEDKNVVTTVEHFFLLLLIIYIE